MGVHNMKVSWFIAHPIGAIQNYILNTFNSYNSKFGGIHFDTANGEKYMGNTIPRKFYQHQFNRVLSKTKFGNTYCYIWLKQKPVDIIHIQHSYLFTNILPLLKFNKYPKIVVTLRGSDTYLSPWISKKWSNFYKHKSDFINAFIVQSKDQKDYLTKFGVKEEKIYIIPISIPKINCLPKEIIPNQRINLISAFRMTWEKNIQGNLLFIYELKKKYPNLHYTIIGEGHDIGQVHYMVDRLGINDVVEIIANYIPNEELKDKMHNYNYYLQLSLSESLSASVIEAQQRGLIPIVSKVGGLQDIVIDNKTGISKDIHDLDGLINSIISIHNNPEKYKTISHNCIQNINDNYVTEVEVSRLHKLYSNLIINR